MSDSHLAEIVKAYSPETIFVEGFKTIRKGISGPRTEKIIRLLFNEMFKNPIVAEFGLDALKRENLRELPSINQINTPRMHGRRMGCQHLTRANGQNRRRI